MFKVCQNDEFWKFLKKKKEKLLKVKTRLNNSKILISLVIILTIKCKTNYNNMIIILS